MLFERHAKAIYNYCFRRTASWDTAEDLLSIVFLEAWRRRDQALPAEKVLPWLYGIATNVLRNRRRSERRFRAALARVPAPRAEPGFEGEADSRLDDERGTKEALDLLAGLSQREQDVFVLCAWSGLSYEDASAALGVPVDAGFFLYELPKSHWRFGHRPDDFFVENAKGKPLAHDDQMVVGFRQAQGGGLAPLFATGRGNEYLWIVLAAFGGFLGGALGLAILSRTGWRRRG